MFTQEELQDLVVILERANITGKDALRIVMLQQKIASLIRNELKKEEKPKGENKK